MSEQTDTILNHWWGKFSPVIIVPQFAEHRHIMDDFKLVNSMQESLKQNLNNDLELLTLPEKIKLTTALNTHSKTIISNMKVLMRSDSSFGVLLKENFEDDDILDKDVKRYSQLLWSAVSLFFEDIRDNLLPALTFELNNKVIPSKKKKTSETQCALKIPELTLLTRLFMEKGIFVNPKKEDIAKNVSGLTNYSHGTMYNELSLDKPHHLVKGLSNARINSVLNLMKSVIKDIEQVRDEVKKGDKPS